MEICHYADNITGFANMLRRMMEIYISRLKGNIYRLDPGLSTSAAVWIAIRRCLDLMRGCFKYPERPFAVFISKGVSLRSRKYLKLGRGVTLGRYVVIDGLSKSGVVLGNNVNIGPYTIIQASGVITRLGTGCTIGENSGIGAYSFIGAGGGVKIGVNVIMGQYVSFHSENHNFSDIEKSIKSQGVTRKGIFVDDDCWVGAKATFLDGANVGKGCVIAAGAVVRGVIPPYSIVGGVPGRIIGSRLSADDGATKRD